MKEAASAANLFAQLPRYTVRGHEIVLDADLAAVYGVPTKRLNHQVRRHPQRFPADFVYLVTVDEWEALKPQIATLGVRPVRRRFLPYAFTEHGALMASSLFRTPRAIEISVEIARSVGSSGNWDAFRILQRR